MTHMALSESYYHKKMPVLNCGALKSENLSADMAHYLTAESPGRSAGIVLAIIGRKVLPST